MPTTYIMRDTTAGVMTPAGADFTRLFDTTTAAGTTLAVSVVAATAETSFEDTPALGADAAGVTGTQNYTVQVRVTAANASHFVSVAVARHNSAGTQQAISSFTAEQAASAVGNLTFSVTGADLGTFASTDRIRVHYRFRNSHASMAQSATYGFNTTAEFLTVPWPALPTFTQTSFRARNDDGTESTATWKAATNTNFDQVRDTNFRLRFLVSSATGAPTQNTAFQLRYSLNGGAYTDVTAASLVARSSASPNVADGAATTEQLAGSGTFNAGTFDEVDGAAIAFTAAPALNHETEVEYCLQLRSADVAELDTVDFRLYQGGNALGTYTATPRASVPAAGTGVRVSFPTPSGTLSAGNVQFLRARVRKTATGTGDPTARIDLWENGVFKSTVLAATTVTSTTGTLLYGSWDVATLTTASGANVECRVVGVDAAGGAKLEVGAIDWYAPRDVADTTLSLTGVTSEETIGTLTPVPSVATLALTGLSSEESVGSPALTPVPGVVTAILTGLASEESVGTLVAVPEVSALGLVGLSSEESVGTLTVSGAGIVSLIGVASEEAVGAPVAAAGVVSLELVGLSSEESVGTLLTLAETVSVALTGVDSEESVGSVTPFEHVNTYVRFAFASPGGTLLVGADLQECRIQVRKTGGAGTTDPECRVEVAETGSGPIIPIILDEPVTSTTGQILSGTWDAAILSNITGEDVEAIVTGLGSIDSSVEIGAIEWIAAIEEAAPSEVALVGVSSEENVGALTPAPGAATVALAGLSSEESVGTLTPTPGVVTVVLTGLTSEETVGTLTVSGVGTVGLSGVSSEESVGTLTPVPTAVSRALTGLSSEESVGALTPAPGIVTVTLVGLTSEETVGTLTTSTAGTIALVGLSSEETVGTLVAVPGLSVLSLVGLSTEESVGALVAIGPPATVVLTGLASEEAVGILSAIFVGEYVGSPTILLSNAPKIRFVATVRQKPQPVISLRDKPQVRPVVRGKPHPVVIVREKAEFTLSSF